MNIRIFEPADWPATWSIVESVLRAGETFPHPTDTTESEAREYWIDTPAATFVAVNDEGDLVGTYYLRPNQPGLGSHVCNCGFMVSPQARGQGVATELCRHSQRQAVAMGFRAMQFNLVVDTNEVSVRLWKREGFDVVGRLPQAFQHPQHGYVDAWVFYKLLQ